MRKNIAVDKRTSSKGQMNNSKIKRSNNSIIYFIFSLNIYRILKILFESNVTWLIALLSL